jgi:DNA-nicking Smr family endonuclease
MSSDPRKHRRRLNEAERALWRGVTRTVAPLKRRRIEAEAAEAAPAERKDRAEPARQAERTPMMTPQAPALKPRTPPLLGLDRRAKQRLARGSDPIDARIDLHGKSQSEAHAALLRFLGRAQSMGARTVLVITGKGARAGDHARERGVLKRQVPLWLRLPEFRIYVVGIDDAHLTHGGEGALYVRLRRAR